MPIPGSPGIPFDWEILVADCDKLAEYAKAVVTLAIQYDQTVRNPDAPLSERSAAMVGLMVLGRKYGLIRTAYTKVRKCGDESDLPDFPGGRYEEQWPPRWPG